MNWTEYFMRQVYLVASKSKDPKTHIGAVLVRNNAVLSQGFNGMPMGVWEHPVKMLFNNIHRSDYHKYCFNKMGDDYVFLEKEEPDVEARFQRPTKYFYFEHAERNAICLAARNGTATNNSIMYTQGIPCADCTRAVIQAGVTQLIVHKQWPLCEGYKEHKLPARYMLQEAGVIVSYFDQQLGIEGFFDGEKVKV